MNEKQQRAKAIVDELLELGLLQNQIAGRVCADQSTICRIHSLERDATFYVGERLVRRLEDLLLLVCKEQSALALSHLPLTVLDACNDAGIIVDQKVDSEIRQAILIRLSNSLVSEAPHVPLPKGIKAAVATSGPDTYIVVVEYPRVTDKPEDEANHTLLLIHELEHVVQRLRNTLPESSNAHRRESAY